MTHEPPADEGAEISTLGAMLLGPSIGVDTIATVTDLGLRPGDFYVPRHQHIAAAIIAVHQRGDPVDVVLVAAQLGHDGLLDEIGGRDALDALTASTPSVTAVAKYAGVVARHAGRRRVIHLAADLSEAAYACADVTVERTLSELVAAHDLGRDDDGWQPVDLTPVLAGVRTPIAPTVLFRNDGRALFYAAAINGVHGDSGTGKGWVMCAAIKAELDEGGTCLLLDLEDSAEAITGRLVDIGVSKAALLERLIYIRPPDLFDRPAVDRLVALIKARTVGLVVIDSLGEAFALEGVDENKDVEVGPWMRRVARRLADAGPCVILVDHATKAADNPLHPSGSKRKRAAIGGASYLVTAPRPLSIERGGRLRLSCAKDRHGNYARGEQVCDIVLTPRPAPPADDKPDTPPPPATVDLAVWAPRTATAGPADLPVILAARAIVKLAQASKSPMSGRTLLELIRVKARTETKRAGLDLAVQYGALAESAGKRGARLFAYAQDLPVDLGEEPP